jgi:CHAT domain-containing protein/Tfp pilus assembly protein PilF
MFLIMVLLLLGQGQFDQATREIDDLSQQVGELYRAGKYPEAIRVADRALALSEKNLGPNHPETLNALSNLGGMYQEQGDYAKAEPLYLRALAIREKAFGPGDSNVAISFNNLAVLYRSKGDYEKAEPLYLSALAIFERVFGPDNPNFASSLNNLAIFYESQERYAQAESLYQRALTIREKALGPEHPDTGHSLMNLGRFYTLLRAYGKADPLLQRAVAIDEKSIGPDHPGTGDALNSLATLYKSEGQLAKAEPLYERASTIYERALGPAHPITADNLADLAALYEAQQDYGKAEQLRRRVLSVYRASFGPDHPGTYAAENNLTLLQFKMGSWSAAAQSFPLLIGNPTARWKLTFGSDYQRYAVAEQREAFLAALHAGILQPDERKNYLPLFLQAILGSKARVTEEERAVLAVMKNRGTADDQKLIRELEDIENRISALEQRNPGTIAPAEYRKERQDLAVKEFNLKAQLSSRSSDFRSMSQDPIPARVSFALRGRVLVEMLRTQEFHPRRVKLFGDLVYTAVALFPDGRIDAVELGPAKPIDDQISAYRQAQEVSDNQAQTRALAETLGKSILAPIVKMTGPYTEWFVAPDGEIRLLPLNALSVNGKYAADAYKIWPISSGRDLLTFDIPTQRGSGDVILANPDFGNGTAFTPLAESEQEAESIGEVLHNAQIVEPANRTKSFLLHLTTAPRILHLSTHAFYYPGTGDATLRSGIALNGANTGPDGILTAKEAQTLRLQGTQLVVMSACDTGVGVVSFADGVVGLQRSLTLAGVRTQMLTEWPVNSAGTRDFMVKFYSKLAAGKTKGDAWLETQRDLIRQGVAPHFWAPFVLYGDPGPLAGR